MSTTRHDTVGTNGRLPPKKNKIYAYFYTHSTVDPVEFHFVLESYYYWSLLILYSAMCMEIIIIDPFYCIKIIIDAFYI